jgi:hypothetical protein
LLVFPASLLGVPVAAALLSEVLLVVVALPVVLLLLLLFVLASALPSPLTASVSPSAVLAALGVLPPALSLELLADVLLPLAAVAAGVARAVPSGPFSSAEPAAGVGAAFCSCLLASVLPVVLLLVEGEADGC